MAEREPGRGEEAPRQADGGNNGHNGGGQEAGPQAETAAQILRNGLRNGLRKGLRKEQRDGARVASESGGTRSAARVGLTGAVILGVAVVAGVAGLALLANSGSHHGASAVKEAGSQAGPNPSAPKLRVVSVTPGAQSDRVGGDGSVQIVFSTKLAATSTVPSFTPAVPGQWQTSGRELSFTPSAPLAPSTRYTLHIPAGRTGLRSTLGGLMARSADISFKTGSYSDLRLDQVLSQLGYLPMTWTPTGTGRMAGGPSTGGVAGQAQLAFSPPRGSFSWKGGYPASLRAQWTAGRPNVVLRGAVMAFQAQHSLAINGVTNRKFWRKLFLAAASSDRNALGYSYAIASKSIPETLTIWHNGHKVFHSLANTGIPIDPTASGTYPVYIRYRFQIMQGTNPDGSHYADPVSFVSYFDGGEAVHYFPRGSYGFPQSLGCVELPYSSAEHAWPYLTYGSLVTVTS